MKPDEAYKRQEHSCPLPVDFNAQAMSTQRVAKEARDRTLSCDDRDGAAVFCFGFFSVLDFFFFALLGDLCLFALKKSARHTISSRKPGNGHCRDVHQLFRCTHPVQLRLASSGASLPLVAPAPTTGRPPFVSLGLIASEIGRASCRERV